MAVARRLQTIQRHLFPKAGGDTAPMSALTENQTGSGGKSKDPNPVTTHALDTATGRPASGLKLVLSRKTGQDANGEFVWEKVAERLTNSDGRVSDPLLDSIEEGEVYEIFFDTAAYFKGQNCFYPYVKIVFEIEDPSSHYHVPLLIAPYGYSTYRGS